MTADQASQLAATLQAAHEGGAAVPGAEPHAPQGAGRLLQELGVSYPVGRGSTPRGVPDRLLGHVS